MLRQVLATAALKALGIMDLPLPFMSSAVRCKIRISCWARIAMQSTASVAGVAVADERLDHTIKPQGAHKRYGSPMAIRHAESAAVASRCNAVQAGDFG